MVLFSGLVGLIVPEGRIGRKGKTGPLFFSFFHYLLAKRDILLKFHEKSGQFVVVSWCCNLLLI
jgi:hypothetical protein